MENYINKNLKLNNKNGYTLKHYPKCKEYPRHDNKFVINKARPYDIADYYWAFSYDETNWNICFDGKKVRRVTGAFDEIVDCLEEMNKDIKPIRAIW